MVSYVPCVLAVFVCSHTCMYKCSRASWYVFNLFSIICKSRPKKIDRVTGNVFWLPETVLGMFVYFHRRLSVSPSTCFDVIVQHWWNFNREDDCACLHQTGNDLETGVVLPRLFPANLEIGYTDHDLGCMGVWVRLFCQC